MLCFFILVDYNSEKKSKRAYEISVLSMEGDSLTDEKVLQKDHADNREIEFY